MTSLPLPWFFEKKKEEKRKRGQDRKKRGKRKREGEVEERISIKNGKIAF
jgi:hypothetical protein